LSLFIFYQGSWYYLININKIINLGGIIKWKLDRL
jgi:hypothetical protein